MKSASLRISNEEKVRHLSPIRSAISINNDREIEEPLKKKSTVESFEQGTSIARNPNEKLKDKSVRPARQQKYSQNVVIDANHDEIKRHAWLSFRKHSPEVKHLKSLPNENEVGNRSKCSRKPRCPIDQKFKLMHLKAKNDHMKLNEKFNEMQTDELYNHLVHDRIRILEQKDKMLDRQTMFLSNRVVIADESPRFSEYFSRFHSMNIPATKAIAAFQSNSCSNSEINEILENMKRIEMKKKLLKSELTKSNEAVCFKTVSLSEEKQKETKQDLLRNCEKATLNSNSNKNSPASYRSDSSPKKTLSQSVFCPSPISKVTYDINDNSSESDQKEKSLSRKHPCKRKLCCRKFITVGSSDTVINKPQNHTSSSSSTRNDFHQNTSAPVKLIVNVLPSINCTIEIKSNTVDKRHLCCTADRNTEKVEDWRTLFKDEEKLIEPSYCSLPDHEREIHAASFEECNEEQVLPDVNTNDVSYYVRKLLLMSPESVNDLHVSSCNTTSIKDSSRNISNHSNSINKQVYSSQKLLNHKQFIDTESCVDDSKNARKLLIEYLKLATAEADDMNLRSFKSVDSSYDKMPGDLSAVLELNDSNISCENFINTAIQRLFPLHQNLLDDNLDYTTQLLQILNHFENQSKDDNVFISPTTCLHKFVSSLSGMSENPDKNYDIIKCLKQYIESQAPSDQSYKISEDLLGPNNIVSEDGSCISFPSDDELIQKCLISKTYAVKKKQNEPKEFPNKEFIKKMLLTDFTSKKSHLKDNSGQNESDNNSHNHQSEMDERFTTDIRKEFSRLGLNWMDTTLRRTLQASIINSTSSAEDSTGSLRNNSKCFFNYRPSISSKPKQQPREFLNISPIKIPDLQLSVPQCFLKN